MSHPWMPLYISDYLADTGHLSAAEHGAYMLLIMRYWQDGGLPADERLIARFSKLTAEQWSESRDVLAALFEDGWKHKRIDEELAKATEIVGKRKAAAERMHSKRNAKADAHAEQVHSTCSDTHVPPSPSPSPEEEHPSPPSVVRPPRAEQGHFLPQDWFPSEVDMERAVAELGSRDAALRQLERFRNYWRSVSGAKGRKRDWDATWRNWIMKEVDDGGRNGNRGAAPRQPVHDPIFAAVGELLTGLPDGGGRQAGAPGTYDAERDGEGVYRLSG